MRHEEERDRLSPELKRYLSYLNTLCEIRWSNRGKDSDEEDEHLAKMDYLWYTLSPEDIEYVRTVKMPVDPVPADCPPGHPTPRFWVERSEQACTACRGEGWVEDPTAPFGHERCANCN